VFELLAQGAKHFVPGVGAVVVSQLLKGVALRRSQERPEMVFGNDVFGVADL
jgi:hypothetical protein